MNVDSLLDDCKFFTKEKLRRNQAFADGLIRLAPLITFLAAFFGASAILSLILYFLSSVLFVRQDDQSQISTQNTTIYQPLHQGVIQTDDIYFRVEYLMKSSITSLVACLTLCAILFNTAERISSPSRVNAYCPDCGSHQSVQLKSKGQIISSWLSEIW